MHTATVVIDLTFGDAGKGSVTDALVRRGDSLVVRHNGGAQAAHTVQDELGRRHTFHQFGSGTLAGAETLLSRFMLVNPVALHYETLELEALGIPDAFSLLHIDGRALVTTPYHVILNRLREVARGAGRHGSCGLGIGETALDALDAPAGAIRFGDLRDAAQLRRKLREHRDRKQRQADLLAPALALLDDPQQHQARAWLDQLQSEDELEAAAEVFEAVAQQVRIAPLEFLSERMRGGGATVFEGAQGVLLDEEWGFHPHTTWSRATSANALQLIEEAGHAGATTVLGLTRCYQTRHGQGPLPTEDHAVTRALPEPDNPANPWQGEFRAGWLDLALLRYALQADGHIDGLVVTCLDRLAELPEVRVASGYSVDGAEWPLVPGKPGCLPERERDGKRLERAQPHYVPVSCSTPHEFAAWTSAQLGLPLLGESHGRTSAEKVIAL